MRDSRTGLWIPDRQLPLRTLWRPSLRIWREPECAITFVQTTTKNRGTSVSTLTGASTDWTSNVTPGNSLFVFAWGYKNDATGYSFSSVTDGGDTFTNDKNNLISLGNDRNPVAIFRSHNVTGGSKPAITVNASGAGTIIFFACEVSGLANAAPDTSNTASSSSSTTAPTGGAITTTVANEILFQGYVGVDANPQTHTAPTSWTKIGEETDNNTYQGGACYYIIVSSIQTAYDPAATTSNSRFAGFNVAYKIATVTQDTPELDGRPMGLSGQRQMSQLLAY